jgi:hypothetical protein
MAELTLPAPVTLREFDEIFAFMVVGLPLRLPGATGSPWNPIAIF